MDPEPVVETRGVATVVLVCFVVLQSAVGFVVREAIRFKTGSEGDPFLIQREPIERLVSMVQDGSKIGYYTNPEDHQFLTETILSPSWDGRIAADLTSRQLNAIDRFFRTQYYAAPLHLDLFGSTADPLLVLANFTPPIAKNPPYQISRLRMMRNFGDGVVLYRRRIP